MVFLCAKNAEIWEDDFFKKIRSNKLVFALYDVTQEEIVWVLEIGEIEKV